MLYIDVSRAAGASSLRDGGAIEDDRLLDSERRGLLDDGVGGEADFELLEAVVCREVESELAEVRAWNVVEVGAGGGVAVVPSRWFFEGETVSAVRKHEGNRIDTASCEAWRQR